MQDDRCVATARTSKTAWVDEGLRALGAGGPDAVRVESLARALNVTKGGFYWHFHDREALLEAILDAWETQLVDDVMTATEATDGDARRRLRTLFSLASDDAVSVDLAVRDWARRDATVAARLRRADTRRYDYMRTLFAEFADDPGDAEVRCLLAFSLWIGNHFIAAEHRGRTRPQVLRLALRHLLR
jgi:AcrR family transcriptional regulator